MSKPKTGDTYRHAGGVGLAARARVADRGVSDELSSEMTVLDMPDGATVTVAGHDDERGLVLVEWTDLHGNPRITSVEPADFAENFTKE